MANTICLKFFVLALSIAVACLLVQLSLLMNSHSNAAMEHVAAQSSLRAQNDQIKNLERRIEAHAAEDLWRLMNARLQAMENRTARAPPRPIVVEQRCAPEPEREKPGRQRRAVVYHATNDKYFCMALLHAVVQRHCCALDERIDHVINHNYDGVPRVPEWVLTRRINDARIRDARYATSNNKFVALDRPDYDELVFVDADSILLRSLDTLFGLPVHFHVAMPQIRHAGAAVGKLASVIVVGRPKLFDFGALVAARRELPDMDNVNEYLAGEREHLLTLAGRAYCWSHHSEHAARCAHSYMLHMSAGGKAWAAPNFAKLHDELHPAYRAIGSFVQRCAASDYTASDVQVVMDALNKLSFFKCRCPSRLNRL